MTQYEVQLAEQLVKGMLIGFLFGLALFGAFWYIWLRPLDQKSKTDGSENGLTDHHDLLKVLRKDREILKAIDQENNVANRIANALMRVDPSHYWVRREGLLRGGSGVMVGRIDESNPFLEIVVDVSRSDQPIVWKFESSFDGLHPPQEYSKSSLSDSDVEDLIRQLALDIPAF